MIKRLKNKFTRKKVLSISDEIQAIRDKVVEMNKKDKCEEHTMTLQHLSGAIEWQVQKANMLKYEDEK